MSGGFAKVSLVGNLCADPSVRFSAGGVAVCNLRVACTERVKKGDKWEDQTEFVTVVVFGKNAENAGQYLQKGRQVYAEGRMQTREWEKDNVKRYSTEVICNDLLFLGGGEGAGKSGGARAAAAAPAGANADGSPPLRDDDIPF